MLPMGPLLGMALLGVLTKITDDLVDEKKSEERALVPAVLYGLLLGWLYTTPFATVCIPVAFAQVIARKIDNKAHALALLLSGLSGGLFAFFGGFPSIDLALAVLFGLSALLDEIDILGMPHFRPFLPLSAFISALMSGDVLYLVGILSFDLFYYLARFLAQRF